MNQKQHIRELFRETMLIAHDALRERLLNPGAFPSYTLSPIRQVIDTLAKYSLGDASAELADESIVRAAAMTCQEIYGVADVSRFMSVMKRILKELA